MKTLAGFVLVNVLLLAAGFAWWLGLGAGDGPEASTQLVGEACNQLQETVNYDVTATIWSTLEGESLQTIVYNGRISGDDYHIRITDLEGERLTTLKYVGGVGYERYGEYDWRVADHVFGDDAGVWEVVGPNPSCPNVSRFRNLGQEVNAQGVTLNRYTNAPVSRFAPPFEDDPSIPGLKVSKQHEILVDPQGRLSVLRINTQTRYEAGNELQRQTFQVEARITGVGEENVITAPVVGSQ